MNTVKTIAARIRFILEQKNMTQYRLAMNSGVSHSTLKNIMHETVDDVMFSTVVLLAGGFDMSLEEFLNDPSFTDLADKL